MLFVLSLVVIGIATWLFQTRRRTPSSQLGIPYVQFEGDNSMARYTTETETILSKGYEQYSSKGLPFSMRDPNDLSRPMVILPVKYLDEIKWLPEQRMSFWRHIDKQSILSQIGGPGITEEVAAAARQGLNSALVHLIESLQEACKAAFTKEIPSCPEWTSIILYPLVVQIFASMSACAIVGPELGGIDSEWQALSMTYVQHALSVPGIVKARYHPWLYWLSRYADPGVKRMWGLRARARELLAPVLQTRIAATKEEALSSDSEGGNRKVRHKQGQRKYEDGVQWLYDAHKARGKKLTPDQLTQDLFVIMTASIHSTSSAGLAIIFDLLEHPDALVEIQREISRVKSANVSWTRLELGELRVLDSFMRESARVHAFGQYLAVQRIPSEDWTFKDGLTIPAGTTLAFPSYHHNRDETIHGPHADTFDAKRYLRKREEPDNAHKFHFASSGEDMMNWGAGRHACPGRFFAQETLKLMIIYLLTHYEFKHAEDTKDAPRFLPFNMAIIPNPTLPILIREKSYS